VKIFAAHPSHASLNAEQKRRLADESMPVSRERGVKRFTEAKCAIPALSLGRKPRTQRSPTLGSCFFHPLRARHQLTLLSSFPMPIDANKETGLKGANALLIWPSEQFCSDSGRIKA
jgi:hypothetical protein